MGKWSLWNIVIHPEKRPGEMAKHTLFTFMDLEVKRVCFFHAEYFKKRLPSHFNEMKYDKASFEERGLLCGM